MALFAPMEVAAGSKEFGHVPVVDSLAVLAGNGVLKRFYTAISDGNVEVVEQLLQPIFAAFGASGECAA